MNIKRTLISNGIRKPDAHLLYSHFKQRGGLDELIELIEAGYDFKYELELLNREEDTEHGWI